MATPSRNYDPHLEQYSNLETVYLSPDAPPKADTGAQVFYTGDNGYEAKEVYNSSYPVAGARRWKKGRIWGMSMVMFVALVTTLIIAAIVGGVVGGVLGTRKKDPASQTAIVPTAPSPKLDPATATLSTTPGSVTSGTSSTFSSSSSSSVPYPTPDIPSTYWHSIESPSLAGVSSAFALTNLYKPSLGGNLKLQSYVPIVDEYMEQYYQHWQFYAITPKHADSSIVLSNPAGVTALYLLAARIPGQETLLVLNSDDYDTFTAGTNTSAMNIRLDMKSNDGDLGRFWFVERDGAGMRIYNYKTGRKWWMAGEVGAELGNEGVVYMSDEVRDGKSVWGVREREFIKPEYDWIV